MNNQHLGSNFDDFLAEEGLLAQAEALAIKRVIVFQLQELIKQNNLSNIEIAQQLKTSVSTLESLLAPDDVSISLEMMTQVANILGKKLRFELV